MSRRHTKAARRRSFREHCARATMTRTVAGWLTLTVDTRALERALERAEEQFTAALARLGVSFDAASDAARRFAATTERTAKDGVL